MTWLALLLACGPAGTADTADTGSPPIDPGELLYELEHAEGDHFYFDTASASLGFQLAYDSDGAVSTWTTFDPLPLDEAEPLLREGDRIPGWAGVEEHLVDGVDQELAVVLTGFDDGERAILREMETTWGADVLAEADIQWLEVEILEWFRSDDHSDAVHVRWALYGEPG